VEADDEYHFVEAHRVDGDDVFECKTGVRKLGLQAAHGDGVGGVLGLGGEHKGNEGLETLILRMGVSMHTSIVG